MVSGTSSGSVVQKTKRTWAGGSSRVFRSAFQAKSVSWCASSMMYTLNFPPEAAYFTFSRRFRISSIPRLLAPSISSTSSEVPFVIATQLPHSLQGSDSPGFLRSQFSALAMRRAVVVLPLPRGPAKR